jgi:hypothetical protein
MTETLVVTNRTGEGITLFVRIGSMIVKGSVANGSDDLYTDMTCFPYQSVYNPESQYSGDAAANNVYNCATTTEGNRTAIFELPQFGELTLYIKTGTKVLSGIMWYGPTALGTANPPVDGETLWKISGGPPKGVSGFEFTVDAADLFADITYVEGFSCSTRFTYGTVARDGTPPPGMTPSSVPTTGFWPRSHDTATYGATLAVPRFPVLASDKHFAPSSQPGNLFPYNNKTSAGNFTERVLISAGGSTFNNVNPIHQHAARLFAAWLVRDAVAAISVNVMESYIGWVRGGGLLGYGWAYDELKATLSGAPVNSEGFGYGGVGQPNPTVNAIDLEFLDTSIPGSSSDYSLGSNSMVRAGALLPSGALAAPGFAVDTFGVGNVSTSNAWWTPYSNTWAVDTGVLVQTARTTVPINVTFDSAPWLSGKPLDTGTAATPVTLTTVPALPNTTAPVLHFAAPNTVLAGASIVLWGNNFMGALASEVTILAAGETFAPTYFALIDNNRFLITLPSRAVFPKVIDVHVQLAIAGKPATELEIKIVTPPPEIVGAQPFQIHAGIENTIHGSYFSDNMEIVITDPAGGQLYTVSVDRVSAFGTVATFAAPPTSTMPVNGVSFPDDKLPFVYQLFARHLNGAGSAIYQARVSKPTLFGATGVDPIVPPVVVPPVVPPVVVPPGTVHPSHVSSTPPWTIYTIVGSVSFAVIVLLVTIAIVFWTRSGREPEVY